MSVEPGLLWMAAGLVMMALELLAPGAFLLWLGIAAVGTGLSSRALALGFSAEVVVFAVLAAVSIGVGLVLRQRVKPSAVNTPGSGLIGRPATALSFRGIEGRVRLGDSDWPARLASGGVSPAPMAALTVVAVDGMVLLVRPVEVAQP